MAVRSKGAEKPAAKGKKGKAGKDPNKPKRVYFLLLRPKCTTKKSTSPSTACCSDPSVV